MKKVTFEIYEFNELGEEAKTKAIENVRERMYQNNDVSEWATDDCYLFEPLHKEMVELFGQEYIKLKIPVIGNIRKNLYYSIDRQWHIDADETIEINNEKMFLIWLGIPESMQEHVYYTIVNTYGRYPDTVIHFQENELGYEFSDEENAILEAAAQKFSNHMDDVLRRIEANYEYYFSDEAIIENNVINLEFTEEGNIF